MEIKAVKFRKEGFYTQPFVMGGEEGPDKFDRNIRYRGSLQNYLIDTGSEVILVDTGPPAGTPEEAPPRRHLSYQGQGPYQGQLHPVGHAGGVFWKESIDK